MNRSGVILTVCLLFFSTLLLPGLSAQDTAYLESIVVESFDEGDRGSEWYVEGSDFTHGDYPRMAYAPGFPSALEAFLNTGDDTVSRNLLGVRMRFDRVGYNRVDIVPVSGEQDDGGNPVPQPLSLPGEVKEIDLWVWGSNHDYEMEIHLQDYLGTVWPIKMGSINFAGWRNIIVPVPAGIPQNSPNPPYLNNLKIAKIVIWTGVTADVSDAIVYFDQIKVLTDSFAFRFDGDELADPETIKEIWGEEE